MAHLGGVINRDGRFIAKTDTKDSGTRFAMEGPLRDDEQQAAQDLSAIRAATSGGATRSGGLKAMQLAAKHLRDAAKHLRDATKAVPWSIIEEVDRHRRVGHAVLD